MAGRIPQGFIDDLLARVNIVDVVEGRVEKFKRAGKNYSGLCPFHKEKSPSFSVSPDKQFYYCFGCGAGGNALSFVMDLDRLEFPEAVEELAKTVGMEVPREQTSFGNTPNQPPREQLKPLYTLLEQSADYYQLQLRQHPDKARAVDYLKQRGLSGQIAKHFGIGFAPAGWDNLSQHLNPQQTQQLSKQLEQTGMLIHNEERDSYYDRFRERIMFPIRDQRGRVIAFGGRVLGDEKPKYLNSPETETFHKGRELYGLYEARHSNHKLERLLIVEGYMDVVSLAQHGIHYAVATLGTATSEHHLQRIFKLVPEVVFCFDGDEAGRRAARRALETTLPCIRDGLQARFLFLPEGEDPDTLVQQLGAEGFSRLMQEESLALSEFFFKAMAENADMASMDGRARFSKDALPLIRTMQPGLLQQMMLDRICEITELSLEQLNSVIDLQQTSSRNSAAAGSNENHQTTPQPPARMQEAPPTYSSGNDFSPRAPRTRQRSLCNGLISILLHHPQLAVRAPAAEELSGINEPNQDLLLQLLEYLKAHPNHTLGMLVVDWQQDARFAARLMLLNEIAHNDPVVSALEPATRQLDDAFTQLRQRRLESRLSELQSKPSSTLSSSEKQEIMQLLNQLKGA